MKPTRLLEKEFQFQAPTVEAFLSVYRVNISVEMGRPMILF